MPKFFQHTKLHTLRSAQAEPDSVPTGSRQRYPLPDTLRGLCLLSMFAYHLLWDCVYLFQVNLSWYRALPGYLWQQSICWSFILLSGFCWPMGRRPLRRGIIVLLGGVLISAVTLLFLPEQRILFGILFFLGSAMLLLIPLDPLLRRIPPLAGAVGSFLLFLLLKNISNGVLGLGGWTVPLPDGLFRNLLTAFLGFPPADFFSTDYFPLLPWFFLFLTGYFCYSPITKGRWKALLLRGSCRPLGWLGRYSLLLYLLHQPVIYLILSLLFRYIQ